LIQLVVDQLASISFYRNISVTGVLYFEFPSGVSNCCWERNDFRRSRTLDYPVGYEYGITLIRACGCGLPTVAIIEPLVDTEKVTVKSFRVLCTMESGIATEVPSRIRTFG